MILALAVAMLLDADLIEARDERLIAISGGCICCSYGSDLVGALMDLPSTAPDIDQIIIEASGVALPGSISSTVGLLGTRFTMEQQFYKARLEAGGLTVLVPDEEDRALVHRVIYEELCLGEVNTSSRQEFLRIIDDLRGRGAEAVIEGCTEIGLLVSQEHTSVPLFDTTRIHAGRAVAEALK